MNIIEYKDVHKSYTQGVPILSNINLAIKKGEFVTLVGPSGCGKTTLLKMLNGLIPFDEGVIEVDGKDIKDWDVIKLRRSIGYVIQSIGLFPHLSVKENINYVLNISGISKTEMDARAEALIELVGLGKELLGRYPSELSGGQKQRIGVARALAADPEIILMDEPFGAVDEIARRNLQDELKELHMKLKKTIIFVTHDINEALKLGTQIVLLNEGEIQQVGTKEELVFSPNSEFVKDFFGVKGFTAMLSEDRMKRIYEGILSEESNVDEIYEEIKKTK